MDGSSHHSPHMYQFYRNVSHTALTSPSSTTTPTPKNNNTGGGSGGSSDGASYHRPQSHHHHHHHHQAWTKANGGDTTRIPNGQGSSGEGHSSGQLHGRRLGVGGGRGSSSSGGDVWVKVDEEEGFPDSSSSGAAAAAGGGAEVSCHLPALGPCVCRNVRFLRWALRNSLRNLYRMDRQKSTSLGALVFQTSVLALTVRYSRTEVVTGPRYLTSTAVVMSELLKLLICLYMALYTADGQGVRSVLQDVLDVREAVRTVVPAGLYTLQNNLQFIAASHLDAATFQVTYQLKILTTALFSVVFLRRQLDAVRWSALVMLTCGVALVQLPDSDKSGESSGSGTETTHTLVGLSAVLMMCLTSGFAGVYFEKILKTSPQSIWAKNVQIAFVSVLLGLAGVVMRDGSKVAEEGFFQGYNALTFVIVIQQALVGLIVSMVMKYADNILKGFASAISIVLTSFISSLILQDLYLSCSFLMGTSIVLISALLYNVDRDADKYTLHMV